MAGRGIANGGRLEGAGARSAVPDICGPLASWAPMVQAANNHGKGGITSIVEEDAAAYQRDGWILSHPLPSMTQIAEAW